MVKLYDRVRVIKTVEKELNPRYAMYMKTLIGKVVKVTSIEDNEGTVGIEPLSEYVLYKGMYEIVESKLSNKLLKGTR